MKKLLIATHGHMASGIKSSIQVLTGLQNQLEIIDAYVDDHDLQAAISRFIEQTEGAPCVILTDIIGGSVTQAVSILAENRENIFVVSGVNLPIVLSLLMSDQPLTKNLLEHLIKECQLQFVELVRSSRNEANENKDFFAS